jgi:hypothetical protein
MAVIRFSTLLFSVILLTFSWSGTVFAQEDPRNQEDAVQAGSGSGRQSQEKGDGTGIQALYETLRVQKKLTSIDIEDPADMPTLFFTLWQHALLKEARKGFTSRMPHGDELERASEKDRVRGIREITLSGILYRSLDGWTVWLNGKRVTPDAIPMEIMDIKVQNEFIDLKWYDSYTNQIFPIRLRPHQRFNLDSRIFLPGIGN